MKNSSSLLFFFVTSAMMIFSSAQLFAFSPDTSEYYNANTLRYEDYVYKKNIRSVQLSSDPAILADAIIRLNSEDKLYLGFDDLDADFKSYSYTFIHCTAKWEPSKLMVIEYLDGFQNNEIHDYAFSRTTLQHYTHYSVTFPNSDAKPLLSGNYLLEIIQDNDPEKIILTKRFMVYDEKMTATLSVHVPTIVADRNFKQEADFTIDFQTQNVTNPYEQIYPVIMQNGRWDNTIKGLQPNFVNNNQASYDYEEGNVFKGGSEFRWFDTRSLKYQSERIQSIEKDSNNIYNVWLLNDDKRTYKRYTTYNDINGKYLVKTTDGGSDDVDADYAWVHFFLPWDPPVSEGTMYVFGAFSNWRTVPECRMTYNYKLKGYEAAVFLKQGYYNYEYVLLRDSDKFADDSFVEGMHEETENEYTLLVYYRKQGEITDELVAVRKAVSNR
jgi:hypothetical protein